MLVPALNEGECIAATVQQWLHSGFRGVRVIDNGSTDNTADLAVGAGAEVVREPIRGYGAAAWRGLQEIPPGIDWVLFSSSDGSDALDPEEQRDWEEASHGADMILGDRSASMGSRAAMNASQRICTAVFRNVVRLGWGRTFGDVGSLRAVRVGVVPDLRLKDRGFGWNVEMQVRAVEAGLRIVELPVQFRPRRGGKSKISGNLMGTVRATWEIIRMLVRLWWTRR